MAYLGAGIIALAVFLVIGKAFVSVNPSVLARAVRYLVGLGIILIAAALGLSGRWGIGLVVLSFGLSVLATGRLGPIDFGGGSRTRGSQSTVRSRFLEMTLDHDSGVMTGRVLEGVFAGRMLDELNDEAVLTLAREVGVSDAQSAALLEAYLDRRIPGWRDDVNDDAAAGAGRAADAGTMTDEEAYEVLGLAPGAGEAEIRAAHRRLMLRMHPDQGGSTFLAAKINQAKDRLLGNHR